MDSYELAMAKKAQLPLPDTTYYAGFDSSGYPGDTYMLDLYANTNIYYTGFYLGKTSTLVGPCCHASSTWMPESSPSSVHTYLSGLGYGFLPLYVGQQQSDSECPAGCDVLTSAQGVDDANHASNLMSAAGFPDDAVCWLDVERGGTLSTDFITYINSWVDQMNNNTVYYAGVYCSYDSTAAQIVTAVGELNVNVWVWDLNIDSCKEDSPFATPAPSGAYSHATALQYAQGCTISNGVTTHGGDLNSSNFTDPSSNPIQVT
jgi:hypothetical protein